MGRCHEFGSQIREGCGHPMRAGERACACPECGVICQGQFDGCPDVWARGPRPISLTIAPAIESPRVRVRALAAGPETVTAQGRPAATTASAATAAPPAPRTTNGRGNGYGNPPPPPPPPRSGPTTGRSATPPPPPGPARTE